MTNFLVHNVPFSVADDLRPLFRNIFPDSQIANKTPSRNSLNPNGTLSSIVQVKLANRRDPAAWEPSVELLKSAKKATKQYNDEHKMKNP